MNSRTPIVCAAVLALTTAAFASVSNDARARGLTRYSEPSYPLSVSDRGIFEGSALIGAAWDENGAPRDVVVLNASEPEFGAAAADAVWRWRRDPALGSAPAGPYEFRFQRTGVIVCGMKTLDAYFSENRSRAPLRVLVRKELDAEPRALVQPMPEFPAQARARNETGRVIVDFYVDVDGRVRAPSVRSATSPLLVPATLESLTQWRFETPRKNGRPAAYAESWVFNFGRAS